MAKLNFKTSNIFNEQTKLFSMQLNMKIKGAVKMNRYIEGYNQMVKVLFEHFS